MTPGIRGAVRACALLLLAGAAPMGCSSDAERRDAHLAEAERYLEQGDLPEALLELRSALQRDPQNADINYRIARTLEQRGAAGDALFFYSETQRLDPSHSEAAVRRASILLHDDLEGAEEIVAEVLEREPDNDFAYVVRSRIALLRNDPETALAPALTAVELGPEQPFTHEQVGKVHAARIRQLMLAEETPPDELYQAAVDAFERAHDLAGDDLRWHFGQLAARVLAAWKGHEVEAEEVFRRTVDETGGSARALGELLPEVTRFADRTENGELLSWSLERHVEAFPAQVGSWARLARLADERGGSGQDVMTRMVEARPESGRARVVHARYLVGHGRRDEAVAYLEQAGAEGVDPPFVLGAQTNMLLAFERGEEAGRVVARLAEQYPDHPRTLLARAQLAAREGRFDEALELLQLSLDRDESVEALRLLAGVERRRGDRSAALAAAERAIAVSPPGAFPDAAMRLRAQLQAETGDCRGAIQSYAAVRREGGRLSDPERLYQARCMYDRGRPGLGLRLLKDLVSQEPPQVAAVLELARLESENDPALVREHLERALVHRPRSPALLGAAARLDAAEGSGDLALERLNAVLSRVAVPELLLLRAQLLVERGELEQAERDAMLAFQSQPELTEAAQLIVAIYSTQGRLDEAIASFEEAEAAGSLDLGAHVLLARLQLAAGNDARAEELLEAALAERADLPGPKNDLAYLLARKGEDLERALQLATEAQESLNEHPAVADTLGYVYLRKGLSEAALAQFRFAIELAEKSGTMSPLYPYHLGLTLRALGLEAEAEEAFEQALVLDADYEDATAELRSLREARSEEAPAARDS